MVEHRPATRFDDRARAVRCVAAPLVGGLVQAGHKLVVDGGGAHVGDEVWRRSTSVYGQYSEGAAGRQVSAGGAQAGPIYPLSQNKT